MAKNKLDQRKHRINLKLNDYYHDLISNPQKIHPRLAGMTMVSLLEIGLDALIIQESNRLRLEEQHEHGEDGKTGE